MIVVALIKSILGIVVGAAIVVAFLLFATLPYLIIDLAISKLTDLLGGGHDE